MRIVFGMSTWENFTSASDLGKANADGRQSEQLVYTALCSRYASVEMKEQGQKQAQPIG